MGRPHWHDEHGRRVPTRACHVPECTREWAVRRYRFERLHWTGWPMTPKMVVDWCGHGQEFVPWRDADGYWVLVPVVEAVKKAPTIASRVRDRREANRLPWSTSRIIAGGTARTTHSTASVRRRLVRET